MPIFAADHPAWDLLRGYVANHGGDQEIEQEIPDGQRSPISLLVAFELRRRRLSFQKAAAILVRAAPDGEEPLSSAGIYHLVTTEHYQGSTRALTNLARAFHWDIAWLRRINGEDLDAGQSLARNLAQDIAASAELSELLTIARSLSHERKLAVLAFARHLATA